MRNSAETSYRGKLHAPRVTAGLCMLFFALSFFSINALCAETPESLVLHDLIQEALKNNPDLLASEARVTASAHRIPQASALPDPMFMFGYQNEGFRRITIGEEPNAQGMFSLSQMFYFPGKRALKGEMAAKETEGLRDTTEMLRLKVAATVKQLYHDLFLAYKSRDIISALTRYYSRVEDAATARYASGMGSQQEVVMAQTEKYMLLEKDEMQKAKIQTIEGMINAVTGRPVDRPLGRPLEMASTPFDKTLDELLAKTEEASPEIRARRAMVEAARAKVKMAKKEYYPDVTLAAGYYPKTQGLLDMWSLTATVNLPVFFTSRQDPALLEAQAGLLAAERELAAGKLMLASSIRENLVMAQSAERLTHLYRDGLIPKARQDFQLAIAGYSAGKTEAVTVISRLKALLDTELLYWNQYAEREKAIARLEATGVLGGSGQTNLPPAGAKADEQERVQE